jgi:pyridoxal phosphate enzyme (YggS family)
VEILLKQADRLDLAGSRFAPPSGCTRRGGCRCLREAIRIDRMISPPPQHDPTAGLAAVRREIAEACATAGRRPEEVTLVAVSKTFGAEAIAPIIAAGQHVFGENRVQEAGSKWPALRDRYPGLALHLIGPLQSNKAREAVGLFDAIHSIDRPSICAAVAKEIQKQGRGPLLFVEVNTGAEAQKAGVLPQDADAFIAACRDSFGLAIAGLMCIPPADEPPAPHFALTAKIAARNGLRLLSMGMSADFPIAIRFGATHVRVGSAIFGQRG